MIKLHTIPKYCPHVLPISNRFLDNIPHYAYYFFAINILLVVNDFLSQKLWGCFLSSKRCVILTDTTLGICFILFASLSEPLQAYCLLKWSSCYFWLQCVKPSRTFLFSKPVTYLNSISTVLVWNIHCRWNVCTIAFPIILKSVVGISLMTEGPRKQLDQSKWHDWWQQ